MKRFLNLVCEFSLLWVLACALLLISVSCGSSRKSFASTDVLKLESGYKSDDASLVIKDNLITEFESSCEDVEITHTIYDTSRVEGPQRIVSQTTYKGKRKTDKGKDLREQESAEESSSYRQEISVSDSVSKSESKVKEETTIPKQMGGMFSRLGMVILLIIILILILKCRKRWLHL